MKKQWMLGHDGSLDGEMVEPSASVSSGRDIWKRDGLIVTRKGLKL